MLLQRERVKAPGELSKAKDEPQSEERRLRWWLDTSSEVEKTEYL
jgi:hypothetical protein